MFQHPHAYLIVNFGGPRSLSEIYPFLASLLTDKDTVRTKLPQFFHNCLFKKIAKRRSKRIEEEYLKMGGCSPIYGDTEAIKEMLAKKLGGTVLTYHRYLPATHNDTFAALEALEAESITVFPMFPQFSYATTGSAARQMVNCLTKKTEQKLAWVKSYANHPEFIALFVKRIQEKMLSLGIVEEETILLFSAHGVPQKFIESGDPYLFECRQSFAGIQERLPKAICRLAFQSKFGPGEWLRPYTQDIAKDILSWHQNRKNVLFVPLSFTSDHIETLVEIEELYMPLIREAGLYAHRVDAFNRSEEWVDIIKNITANFMPTTSKMLVR